MTIGGIQEKHDTPTRLMLTIVQAIKEDQPLALVVDLRDLLKRHYPGHFAIFQAVVDTASADRRQDEESKR